MGSDLAPPRTGGMRPSKTFPAIREIHLDPFLLTVACSILADGGVFFISRSFHAPLLISRLDSLRPEVLSSAPLMAYDVLTSLCSPLLQWLPASAPMSSHSHSDDGFCDTGDLGIIGVPSLRQTGLTPHRLGTRHLLSPHMVAVAGRTASEAKLWMWLGRLFLHVTFSPSVLCPKV